MGQKYLPALADIFVCTWPKFVGLFHCYPKNQTESFTISPEIDRLSFSFIWVSTFIISLIFSLQIHQMLLCSNACGKKDAEHSSKLGQSSTLLYEIGQLSSGNLQRFMSMGPWWVSLLGIDLGDTPCPVFLPYLYHVVHLGQSPSRALYQIVANCIRNRNNCRDSEHLLKFTRALTDLRLSFRVDLNHLGDVVVLVFEDLLEPSLVASRRHSRSWNSFWLCPDVNHTGKVEALVLKSDFQVLIYLVRNSRVIIKGKSSLPLGEYPRYIYIYQHIPPRHVLDNGCIGQYVAILGEQLPGYPPMGTQIFPLISRAWHAQGCFWSAF